MQRSAFPLRPAVCLLFLIGTAFTATQAQTPTQTMVVALPRANIRATPAMESKVVATVPKGDIMLIYATVGDWEYVASDRVRGWMHNSTLRELEDGDLPDLSRFEITDIHANSKSRIYHLPGCPNYDDITLRNIVYFKTREEAEKAGYRRARNCPRK